MKTYLIPQYGIEVIVTDKGTGTISSDLKKHLIGGEENDLLGIVDAIESLIMAHACSGVDIASPAYVTGLETCLEAIGNNF